MDKEEIQLLANITQEIFENQYNSIKDLSNKELRKVIENSNWNFILQIIRFLENEISILKEENTKLNIKLEDRAYEELKVAYEKAKEENQELKGSLQTYEILLKANDIGKLNQQLDLYKSVIDEIREYINTLLNDANSKESDLYIYEQNKAIMEYILQILDKARENTQKEEVVDNNTIINENGKNFKCLCGSNVFSKTNKNNYICHCCNRSYCESKESE